MKRPAAVWMLLAAACAPSETDPATEHEAAPTVVPEVVGEGVVSTQVNQTFPTIDPVTGDLWFSEYDDSFDDQTIRLSRPSEASWSEPVTAPFSGQWGDRAPRFSPDGSWLYFTSNRPRPDAEAPGDMNIWRVHRSPDGWGQPELLPSPFNSDAADIHSTVTASGVWLASNREGSFGRSDIYHITEAGVVTHLEAPINDENSQPDLWVSEDETWMILVITDHPEGRGGDDLWKVSRTDSGWSSPIHLGPEINSAEYEYGPSVSPDGQFLYFTSHREDISHVYRVPITDIEALNAGS